MYHSITIGTRNTYDDWHLVPDGRPVVSMPEPKLTTINIPGRNGLLDLSESIRKFPVFSNRTGSWKFHVLNDKIYWVTLYERIATYLHGKYMQVILEDDPGWYYQGRIMVKNWVSNNNGTWSDVELGYSLEPYKLAIEDSITEAWLWDPFSFVNGRIFGTNMKNILIPSTSYNTINLHGLVGTKPISPKFYIYAPRGIDLVFINKELQLSITKTGVTTGTYEWPEVVFTEFDENNELYIKCKKSNSNTNKDTITIEYRVGSL